MQDKTGALLLQRVLCLRNGYNYFTTAFVRTKPAVTSVTRRDSSLWRFWILYLVLSYAVLLSHFAIFLFWDIHVCFKLFLNVAFTASYKGFSGCKRFGFYWHHFSKKLFRYLSDIRNCASTAFIRLCVYKRNNVNFCFKLPSRNNRVIKQKITIFKKFLAIFTNMNFSFTQWQNITVSCNDLLYLTIMW